MSIQSDGDLGLIPIPNPINFRRIALAVLLRSLIDLATTPRRGKWRFASYGVKPKDLLEAKVFCLTENDQRDFWCNAAGVSTIAFAKRAKLVIEGKISKEELDKGYERLSKGTYGKIADCVEDQQEDGDDRESDSEDQSGPTKEDLDRLELTSDSVH